MKYLWGIAQTLIILTFMSILVIVAALFLYGAPLRGEPGFFSRTWTYLTVNRAETEKGARRVELRPVEFQTDPARLYAITLRAVRGMKWGLAAHDARSRTIVATVSTPFVGLTSDITITVLPAPYGRSTLHVRAVSRQPWGDLGANTNYIQRLYRAVDIVSPLLAR